MKTIAFLWVVASIVIAVSFGHLAVIICIGVYVGWQGLHAFSVAGAI